MASSLGKHELKASRVRQLGQVRLGCPSKDCCVTKIIATLQSYLKLKFSSTMRTWPSNLHAVAAQSWTAAGNQHSLYSFLPASLIVWKAFLLAPKVVCSAAAAREGAPRLSLLWVLSGLNTTSVCRAAAPSCAHSKQSSPTHAHFILNENNRGAWVRSNLKSCRASPQRANCAREHGVLTTALPPGHRTSAQRDSASFFQVGTFHLYSQYFAQLF